MEALEAMPAEHKFLRFILPAKAFAAVRDGTRQWLIECRCGHKRDLWDAGGVQYKAAGSEWTYNKCPKCGAKARHETRKKTEAEKHEIEVK